MSVVEAAVSAAIFAFRNRLFCNDLAWSRWESLRKLITDKAETPPIEAATVVPVA